jgi:hypothetical protein
MNAWLQERLFVAALTVDQWRPSAIGGLLVVIALCIFVVLWLVLDDEGEA